MCVCMCASCLSAKRIASHAQTVQHWIQFTHTNGLEAFSSSLLFFDFFSLIRELFFSDTSSVLLRLLNVMMIAVRCIYMHKRIWTCLLRVHLCMWEILMCWPNASHSHWIGQTEMKWDFKPMIMAVKPCVVCFFSLFYIRQWAELKYFKRFAYLSCSTQQCAYSPYRSHSLAAKHRCTYLYESFGYFRLPILSSGYPTDTLTIEIAALGSNESYAFPDGDWFWLPRIISWEKMIRWFFVCLFSIMSEIFFSVDGFLFSFQIRCDNVFEL